MAKDMDSELDRDKSAVERYVEKWERSLKKGKSTKKEFQFPNLFSSKGGLGAGSFVASILLLGVASYFFGVLMEASVNSLRTSSHVRILILVYILWIVGASIGFFCISNCFIKRWSEIRGGEIESRFNKILIRTLLLSPLLSIWLTGLTLLYAKWGLLFRDGEPKSRAKLISILSLGLFHIGILVWQVNSGTLEWHGFSLKKARFVSPLTSLQSIRDTSQSDAVSNENGKANALEMPHLPGEGFYAHVHPYLNPGAKYLTALYADVSRGAFLMRETLNEASPLCARPLGYLGVLVRDCFFYNYRLTGAQSAFTTPLVGLYIESRYRAAGRLSGDTRAESGRSQDERITSLVSGALIINNLLSLLEGKWDQQDRNVFFEPEGLVRYFSSPEIPILLFGQDIQKYLARTKLLPQLKPRIEALEGFYHHLAHLMKGEQASAFSSELVDFRIRIENLERDLLGTLP